MSVYGTDTLVYPADFLDRSSGDTLARRLGSRFNGIITFLSASLLVKCRWCRNISLLCIDYALRPRLSFRLTLGGRTWPRKPWVYGEQDSHLFYRYSCLHSHFGAIHCLRLGHTKNPYGPALSRTERSPTTPASQVKLASAASVCGLIANHFRRDIAR